MTDFQIVVVPDQACPTCGAYDGHPDPEFNFPNRIKVDTHWKCYNPACDVGFYEDGVVLELKPTPEEAAEMNARVAAEVDAMCAGKQWVNVSPEGAWYETWVLQ
jgi:hypothetical protein